MGIRVTENQPTFLTLRLNEGTPSASSSQQETSPPRNHPRLNGFLAWWAVTVSYVHAWHSALNRYREFGLKEV